VTPHKLPAGEPRANVTPCFVETFEVGVCHGPYSKPLVRAWHKWDKAHGSGARCAWRGAAGGGGVGGAGGCRAGAGGAGEKTHPLPLPQGQACAETWP